MKQAVILAAGEGRRLKPFIEQHHPVKVGAMLGEGCILGSNVVALPGVIAGNYTQVQALKLISGQLPDRSLVF